MEQKGKKIKGGKTSTHPYLLENG